MKSKSAILVLALLTLFLFNANADLKFESLDLNQDNKLLFTAQATAPVYGSYNSSFEGKLDTKFLRHLTWFPESISYLSSSNQLQIQNRFGVFRTKVSGGDVSPVAGLSSFLNGGEVGIGKLGPVQASPDGRFVSYIRPTSSARGDLILYDIQERKDYVISTATELTLSTLPVRWASDSSICVYQKNGRLHYFSLNQAQAGKMPDEKLRSIGPGTIASVTFGFNNELIYVSGKLVYEIRAGELFTRSFYQDFLKPGKIIGRLPQGFDAIFDRFWVAPSGRMLLLDKGGNNIFLYLLGIDDYDREAKAVELPYLLLPRYMELKQVLWSNDDRITLLTSNRTGPILRSIFYRLDTSNVSRASRFVVLESPASSKLVSNGTLTQVLLVTPTGVQVRNYHDWALLREIRHPEPLHAIWVEANDFVIAGRWYTELVRLPAAVADSLYRQFLFFSQAEAQGFDKETGLPVIKSKDQVRTNDEGKWLSREPYLVNEAVSANQSYRVYLETLYSGPYVNLVMVRKTQDLGTFQLFDPPKTTFEELLAGAGSEPVNFEHFQHGNRLRRRSVSLTFNAIDSADGLGQILATLDSYNVKATFFVSGEFIRRFPGASREIAEAGHEIGNLFYQYFNMSDPRYQISADFIKQGLARNEDDFNEATGQELTLLWRTPYYIVNDMILKAGRELNYTMVGKDVDSLDSVTRFQGIGLNQLYQDAASLVEFVIKQKKPGSVIAMTVGRPGFDENIANGRDDYLFQKLDVLINGLLQRGYEIVPVSALIEQAR